MGNYSTCHNCQHNGNDCASKARVRTAITGLGVTSIKFRCADRAPLYRPGDRVAVTWTAPGDDGYYDDSIDETWPATIISEKGSRFIICVDDVRSDEGTLATDFMNNKTRYARVSALKLKPLDEPKRRVCGLCGIVANDGFAACWQQGCVPSARCLKAITEPPPLPHRITGDGTVTPTILTEIDILNTQETEG